MTHVAQSTEGRPSRPVISEVVKDDAGASSFTVTFRAWQVLPTHQNPSRVLINVLAGEGFITVGEAERSVLVAGKVVQIAPNASHSLVAGPEGMLVEVHLVADCCASC